MSRDISFSLDELNKAAASLQEQAQQWQEYTSRLAGTNAPEPEDDDGDDDSTVRSDEDFIHHTINHDETVNDALGQVGSMLNHTSQALRATAADYAQNEQAIAELVKEQLGGAGE